MSIPYRCPCHIQKSSIIFGFVSIANTDEHAQPLFKDLNLLNFQQTIKFNLGKFMWDVKENNFPNHIINYLNINKKTKSFRPITVTNKHVPL